MPTPVCDDLRIGGTLSATGIASGISIQNTRMMVADWTGVFGHVGFSLRPVQASGRPGSTLVGDGLALSRSLTLPLTVTRWGPTDRGLIVASSEGKQLWDNTDLLLGYLADPAGFYLEVDDPETGSRYVQAYAISPAAIRQREWRRMDIPLISPWPYWREGGNEQSVSGTGAGTITIGGNVKVYDAVLTFSAAGTYTNSTAGWNIVVSAACVVNLLTRRITVGGVNSDNLLTSRSSRDWGWFVPGANTIGRTTTIGTVWRDQYE